MESGRRKRNRGLFTNSLCFLRRPPFVSRRPPRIRGCLSPPASPPECLALRLTAPAHIALQAAHTCRPAVYCHYNYDCQNRSTNVLIWYSGTFITNNWAPCFLFERFKGFKSKGRALMSAVNTQFGSSAAAAAAHILVYVPRHCPFGVTGLFPICPANHSDLVKPDPVSARQWRKLRFTPGIIEMCLS